MTSPDDSAPISERVRFWEEQDKINQELIPRVIRQHELLTGHIAEHENLSAVVANAVQQAIAGARDGQRKLYESALETAKAEFAERASEQQRQYEKSLEAARTELNRQMQETLNRETRRMRNLVIGIATVFGIVIVVATVLVSLILG